LAAVKPFQRRGQRTVGFLLVVCLLFLGGYLLITLLKDDLRPQIIEIFPAIVDLDLQQVHFSQSENGEKRWGLNADRAAYQLDDDLLMLTGVKMTFFQLEHFGDVVLTAEKGDFYRKKNKLELHGAVKMEAHSGEVFKSESLLCDLQKRLLTTADPVDLQNPSLHLTGEGMRMAINDGVVHVLQNVHAQIIPLEKMENHR